MVTQGISNESHFILSLAKAPLAAQHLYHLVYSGFDTEYTYGVFVKSIA